MQALRGTGPVLVVDDDAVVRRMICQALEDDGFTVLGAPDGELAIEQAARYRPTLIVLDATLPTFRAQLVAPGIRAALGHDVPILLTTAANNAAESARALRAYAYLRKPFDVEELMTSVRLAPGYR